MLDIFYNEIITEAKNGSVDADAVYNILFNTEIPEMNIDLKSNIANENVFVPTLYIKNVKIFNELLSTYLNLSLNFYDANNFIEDFVQTEEEIKKLRTKTILTLLWSNTTIEDFNNPIDYLRKRIAFFKNRLEELDNWKNIGFSENLDSYIKVKNSKSNIKKETPYKFSTVLENNGSKFDLPDIYYALDGTTLYIYAIQNKKDINIENNFHQKNVKRKLYGINEGLDVKEDTFENYDIGNLKDVTPSFLLATNILVGILSNEIDKIIVPSILLSRWNDKELMYSKKEEKLNNFDAEKYREEHNCIQSNLTEKLLRIFLRLSHHSDGIEVTNYPFELNSSLELKVGDIKNFNNKMLNETYCLTQNKKTRNLN